MTKFRESIKPGPAHDQIEKDQNVFYYKRRFYAGANDFTYFANVDANLLGDMNNILAIEFPEGLYPYHSYERYIAVMEYLLKAKMPFDEKLIFLIKAVDPNLLIYFYYLQIGYSSLLKNGEKSDKENELIKFIEGDIGAFDPQLLKYEELYLLAFLKNKDIISGVNTDYSTKFFPLFKKVTSFAALKNREFHLIEERVNSFKASCTDPQNLNTVCYNISNPNSELAMWSSEYKIIFFILAIDPELNALKIYAEESHINNIKERMIRELGFYQEDLIRIEKIYQKRFYPEWNRSTWSL